MTLAFDFHPEARAEFFADVDWYDDREAGVGARFEVAVRQALMPLSNRPSRGPAGPAGTASRWCAPKG